jgi:hypothetical protein
MLQIIEVKNIYEGSYFKSVAKWMGSHRRILKNIFTLPKFGEFVCPPFPKAEFLANIVSTALLLITVG